MFHGDSALPVTERTGVHSFEQIGTARTPGAILTAGNPSPERSVCSAADLLYAIAARTNGLKTQACRCCRCHHTGRQSWLAWATLIFGVRRSGSPRRAYGVPTAKPAARLPKPRILAGLDEPERKLPHYSFIVCRALFYQSIAANSNLSRYGSASKARACAPRVADREQAARNCEKHHVSTAKLASG